MKYYIKKILKTCFDRRKENMFTNSNAFTFLKPNHYIWTWIFVSRSGRFDEKLMDSAGSLIIFARHAADAVPCGIRQKDVRHRPCRFWTASSWQTPSQVEPRPLTCHAKGTRAHRPEIKPVHSVHTTTVYTKFSTFFHFCFPFFFSFLNANVCVHCCRHKNTANYGFYFILKSAFFPELFIPPYSPPSRLREWSDQRVALPL